MRKEDFAELLHRYLAGQCTEEEEKWLDNYYALLDQQLAENLNEEELLYLENGLWYRIKCTIGNANQKSPEEEPTTFRTAPYLWGIAATIALVMGCFGLVKWQLNRPQNATFPIEASVEIEVKNTSGKTMHHDLQDGSIVWLEPGAGIKYARHFAAAKRDVYLIGKAFFDVAHDPQRPFSVIGKTVVVKVLGTSFSANYSPGQPNAEVWVRNGKVSVYALPNPPRTDLAGQEKKAKNIVLLANQKAAVNSKENKIKREAITPDYWQKQEQASNLIFNNTPIAEVIQQVEDAYQVSIQIANPLLYTCSFTASLKDQSLEQKLEIICKSIGADYKSENGKYIITGEGCQLLK